jgi:phosphoribosylaminoimidazolecarboxamide formyltransferase/IMP cyclohydrolase
VGGDPTQAFELALAGDPVSAFGGVIGSSRLVTPALAKKITATFFEAVIAPGYAAKALEILRTKKDLRILQAAPGGGRDDLSASRGYLIRTPTGTDPRCPQSSDRHETQTDAAEYRALDSPGGWCGTSSPTQSSSLPTTAAGAGAVR